MIYFSSLRSTWCWGRGREWREAHTVYFLPLHYLQQIWTISHSFLGKDGYTGWGAIVERGRGSGRQRRKTEQESSGRPLSKPRSREERADLPRRNLDAHTMPEMHVLWLTLHVCPQCLIFAITSDPHQYLCHTQNLEYFKNRDIMVLLLWWGDSQRCTKTKVRISYCDCLSAPGPLPDNILSFLSLLG